MTKLALLMAVALILSACTRNTTHYHYYYMDESGVMEITSSVAEVTT